MSIKTKILEVSHIIVSAVMLGGFIFFVLCHTILKYLNY